MRRIYWLLPIMLCLTMTPVRAADKTVGMIMSGNITYYQDVHKAFSRALAKEGYSNSKVKSLLQMPAPDPLSWTNAARKFVVAEVDLLVTYGASATLAAIGETKSIPIVFAGVYDPAGIGAKRTNTSGVSATVPMTSVLKYLQKLVPYTRLAVVYHSSEQDSVRQVSELGRLEGTYGFKTVKMPIRKPDDAKKLVFKGKADAVLLSMSAVVNEAIGTIVQQAQRAKIPTVSQMGGTAEKGVVLSLFPSPVEQGTVAAKTAVRLLRGDRPAGIPVRTPRRVEFVLNLAAARKVGITVPFQLITDATKVIK